MVVDLQLYSTVNRVTQTPRSVKNTLKFVAMQNLQASFVLMQQLSGDFSTGLPVLISYYSLVRSSTLYRYPGTVAPYSTGRL